MDQTEPLPPGRGHPRHAVAATEKNGCRIDQRRTGLLMIARNLAILAVAILISQVTPGRAMRVTEVAIPRHGYWNATVKPRRDTGQASASKQKGGPSEQAPPTREVAELSPEARQVGEIAVRNGDRDFLMVDKPNSVLFYFKDGKPVFSDTVLTGIGPADRLTPEILAKPFSAPTADHEKITPAGRFTVSRQHDDLYGTIFEINEIHGKDWALAIHQVYVGEPREKRMERLKSPTPLDNYVSYGCINLDKKAIQYLSRTLPKKGKTPLYILPRDETKISTFFPEDRKASP